MTDERYKDLPTDIRDRFERQDRIKDLEKTDPLVKQLTQIKDAVRQEENKVGEYAYVVDLREQDGSGFYFYSDLNWEISIAEGSHIIGGNGRNRIKRKVMYSNGHLSLGVDYTLIPDETSNLFEEPGESKLMPDEKYKYKARGQWADTVSVEGPIDSMGENTLRYAKKLVGHALVELTY